MSGNAAIVRLAELFAKAAIAQARADMETQQPQGGKPANHGARRHSDDLRHQAANPASPA